MQFQSTLPRGERQDDILKAIEDKLFQSTLPRGERQDDILKAIEDKLFQSTLPRGERLQRVPAFMIWRYFNPRSHEGSDTV